MVSDWRGRKEEGGRGKKVGLWVVGAQRSALRDVLPPEERIACRNGIALKRDAEPLRRVPATLRAGRAADVEAR